MRVNFNYFVSDVVVDYVVEAVRMVARDGWKLLGDYLFDTVSGRWRHREGVVTPPLSLRDVEYAGGEVRMPRHRERADESVLASHLGEAAAVLAAATPPDLSVHPGSVSEDFEHLRWFDLPKVCLDRTA